MNDDLIWLNITSSWQERVVLLSKGKFDQIIRNQDQSQSCVLLDHFSQSNHFDLLWLYCPVEHSSAISIEDGSACSPAFPFTSHDGRFGPVSDQWTGRPAALAGQQHSLGNAECLAIQRGGYPSTWHAWAKGFLLIKSHLEAMTSTRPLCLSICSSLPDLFYVWKLNS